MLCSALACMVAGEAPQIRTVDKSIELNVSDQSIALNVPRDEWYRTTEPLSRVGAGEELIFYDPITFEEMGRATTALRAEET